MEAISWFGIGVGLTIALVILRQKFAAFQGQAAQDYDDSFPTFEIKKHLNGNMVCEGVIFGPLGRVTSSFVADFDVTWDGDTARIDEKFKYNDGSTQTREWTIQMGENGRFVATAPDVPGRGHGAQSGSTVHMLYPIKLPEDVGGHVLKTVDWMYLTPGGTIMNRSQFRKFGFKVAELVATIRPRDEE